jgi:hypothetical protein
MASNFEDRLDNIRNSAQTASSKLVSSQVNPPWCTLLGTEPEDIVDPFTPADIRKGFARDQEAKDYDKALTTPESFRNAQAAKLQSDALAAVERDTRMRHRTRVRMFAHAAAKMTTQGLEDGPLKRAVLFVQRLKEQTDGSND